ncbi:ArsR/SmtB family transcription factor [Nakamurella panacisegetis]|uniref:ArsR/SmtB family transcription factor n=1 Tax=Nakamurella panacisegetis TaxID=1090615 RepID=UPI000B8626DB|nr:metalloregulator ArsR/SmtB family transcription factor [Nakamurella panacisegetis]
MPKYQSDDLDRLFHALGDRSRRAMIERLTRGPASVSDLARPFDMALPSLVQHLGVLEAAGLVTSTKVGRVRTVQLVPGALEPARTWVTAQKMPAERQLDRLGAYLATGGGPRDPPGATDPPGSASPRPSPPHSSHDQEVAP